MNKFLLLLPLLVFLSACGARNDAPLPPASLDELNRALDAVVMYSNGKFPPDTNEVVRFLGMWGKAMPVPPSGQTLIIDPVTHRYIFTATH